MEPPSSCTASIQGLSEGEISEPIASLDNEGRSGNLVYKIIKVDKIIPAHTATFDSDFDQLSEQVMVDKQNQTINAFVDKKLKDTYIVIDPLFEGCEFSRPGWSEKIRKSD